MNPLIEEFIKNKEKRKNERPVIKWVKPVSRYDEVYYRGIEELFGNNK